MRWLLNISTLEAADGGPPNAVLNVATELALRGDSVTVLHFVRDGVQAAEALAKAAESGVQFHPIPIQRLGRFRFSWRQLVLAHRLAAHADVVTTHGFYQFTCVAAWFAARRRMVPLLVQPHGVFEPYQEATSRHVKRIFMRVIGDRVLREAAAILVATEQEMEGVAESAGPGTREKLVQVGLGVTVPSVDQLDIGRYQSRRVLFLSRIAEKKRIDLLIEAIRLTLPRMPGIHLVVAGSGPPDMTARFVKQAAGLPVRFVGQVVGEEKAALYRGCALYCLPSDNENFGQAVVEAMSFAAPVVTTDVVGASSHVLAAGAGWVLKSPSAPDLADALIKALDDPQALLATGSRAREYAVAELGWAAVADRLRSLPVLTTARLSD